MFAIAIVIELYAYAIFAIGLAKLLTPAAVLLATVLVAGTAVWYMHKKANVGGIFAQVKSEVKDMRKSKVSLLFVALIVLQIGVNLVGALGPELGFDALWYHLTLPKIFIEQERISFIPGGLLYYSVMPKMIDILYIPPLMFGSEITAKLVHFALGLLTTLSIYIFTKRHASQKIALAASLIFYSNLVVAWQSTTAYIDLGRTFFEFLALVGFLNFQRTNSRKWLLESGIMAGAALSTKWLASGTLIIFAMLFMLLGKKFIYKAKDYGMFVLISLFVVIPHLAFSFTHTGSPFYPIFSQYYPVTADEGLLNPINFFKDIGEVFLFSPDPISPIYVVMVPVMLVLFKKFTPVMKTITVYCAVALAVWYITPQTGGGRFILPYLPAFSVLGALTLDRLENKYIKKILIAFVVCIALTTIIYRGTANARYIPVVTGIQNKAEFLEEHLNFPFGDFYDTDGYISKTVTKEDTVLVYGIHNLYYLNVPFIHESYVQDGDEFNYILVGGGAVLPQRFHFWDKIYENEKTGVRLYTNNDIKWVY